MKKNASMIRLLLLFSAIILSGCVSAPFVPPLGVAYTDIRSPLDTDLSDTNLGSKVGQATASSILGLFAQGDASIATAAEYGDISMIKHVDYAYKNILGIYQETTVIVYGD